MQSRIPVACLLLFWACAALAQQYRWMDEKGRVQYTDTPPPPSAKGVQKKALRNEPAPSGQEAFAFQVARKNSPVTLYSSPDCGPSCEDARKLLVQRGIPFNETSVTKIEQIEELKRLTGSAIVPVMVVGSAVQKGFETASYHRALDTAGYPRSNPPLAPSQKTAPSAATPPGPAIAPAPATPAATQPDNMPTK